MQESPRYGSWKLVLPAAVTGWELHASRESLVIPVYEEQQQETGMELTTAVLLILALYLLAKQLWKQLRQLEKDGEAKQSSEEPKADLKQEMTKHALGGENVEEGWMLGKLSCQEEEDRENPKKRSA